MQTQTVRPFQMIRASYGIALLLVPGKAIRLATGRCPSRRTRQVAQLLGARHLLQTALTAVMPRPRTFALGGEVDTLHATSMLLLAALSRPGRRVALTDALTEAAFAAAGFSAARGCGELPPPVRKEKRSLIPNGQWLRPPSPAASPGRGQSRNTHKNG
jgi:hypothetical protein